MQNRTNLAIAVSLHRNSHTHSQPTSLVGNTTKVKLARSPVPGTWEIPSLEPSGGGGEHVSTNGKLVVWGPVLWDSRDTPE